MIIGIIICESLTCVGIGGRFLNESYFPLIPGQWDGHRKAEQLNLVVESEHGTNPLWGKVDTVSAGRCCFRNKVSYLIIKHELICFCIGPGESKRLHDSYLERWSAWDGCVAC